MKIDTLPYPLPTPPGCLWIDAPARRLMISDGERFIPLVPLRHADAGRLAVLLAELAEPALSEP